MIPERENIQSQEKCLVDVRGQNEQTAWRWTTGRPHNSNNPLVTTQVYRIASVKALTWSGVCVCERILHYSVSVFVLPLMDMCCHFSIHVHNVYQGLPAWAASTQQSSSWLTLGLKIAQLVELRLKLNFIQPCYVIVSVDSRNANLS